jgi:hypothetical protein
LVDEEFESRRREGKERKRKCGGKVKARTPVIYDPLSPVSSV